MWTNTEEYCERDRAEKYVLTCGKTENKSSCYTFPSSFFLFSFFLYILSLLVRSFASCGRGNERKRKKKKREREVKKKRNVCYYYYYYYSSDFRWSTHREFTMTGDNSINNTIDVFLLLFSNAITPYFYTYHLA
jgi:hypothetical protein